MLRGKIPALMTAWRGPSRIDLVDSDEVPASLEIGRKPRSHNGQGLGFRDRPLANRENVAVVVRSIPLRELFIPADSAPDSAHPVGNDGFTIPGTAEHDATFELAAGDSLRNRPDEIGIIARRIGMRAKVAHRVALCQQHGLDGFLVGEAGVIGTEGNGERAWHVGKWRAQETGPATGCRNLGRDSSANQIPAMRKFPVLFPALIGLFALAACSTVDSRIAKNREAYSSWPMDVREKVAAGEIALGFTADQVRVALGDPSRVFVRSTADGTSEVWSYRSRKPRIGVGVGVGFGGFSGSRTAAGGVGIGTGGGYHDDEKLGVVFDERGRVAAIETRG
jgi:outer membrane protein assembly factor BamE (lipoprotein component of BamABCDE complex)